MNTKIYFVNKLISPISKIPFPFPSSFSVFVELYLWTSSFVYSHMIVIAKSQL